VVDRAAVEAPDTLLLAEAFWLMEGYFVRTLGMHRVYNSAFMNMLRNEENAGYRKLIRNTLEFDPQILKRYVNFMNNPDELTAVEQFGKGDKYFGICMLMATMPGLPMLGHGQIEGYSEKYGMEFRKAYLKEQVDHDLVSRHEWEIFPLLHQRELFSGVDQFNLYDFVTHNGNVNENVYAYSNFANGNTALVIFNNKYEETEGYIHYSIAQQRQYALAKKLEQVPLAQALHLPEDRSAYVIFRDQVTRLQYLRPLTELYDRGLFFKLRAYQYHTFLDFRVVHSDSTHDYSALYEFIGNQGVPDNERAMTELVLKPVLEPYRTIINQGYLDYLLKKYATTQELDTIELREIPDRIGGFLSGIAKYTGVKSNQSDLRDEIVTLFSTCLALQSELGKRLPGAGKKAKEIMTTLLEPLRKDDTRRVTLLTWALCSLIGKLTDQKEYPEQSLSWFAELQLNKPFLETLRNMQTGETEFQQQNLLLRIGISHQDWFEDSRKEPLQSIVKDWFSDPEVQNFLRVNRYHEVLWYNREAFNDLVWFMALLALCKHCADPATDATTLTEVMLHLHEIMTALKKIEQKSGYKFDRLFELGTK